MPTSTELRDAAKAAREAAVNATHLADELLAKARKTEREERQAKQREAEAAHSTRLFEESGQPLAGLNEAQHAIVYGQAYRDGHSAGLDEVENYYGEYAEMARKLLEAN